VTSDVTDENVHLQLSKMRIFFWQSSHVGLLQWWVSWKVQLFQGFNTTRNVRDRLRAIYGQVASLSSGHRGVAVGDCNLGSLGDLP